MRIENPADVEPALREAFTKHIREEYDSLGKLVKSLGLKKQ